MLQIWPRTRSETQLKMEPPKSDKQQQQHNMMFADHIVLFLSAEEGCKRAPEVSEHGVVVGQFSTTCRKIPSEQSLCSFSRTLEGKARADASLALSHFVGCIVTERSRVVGDLVMST